MHLGSKIDITAASWGPLPEHVKLDDLLSLPFGTRRAHRMPCLLLPAQTLTQPHEGSLLFLCGQKALYVVPSVTPDMAQYPRLEWNFGRLAPPGYDPNLNASSFDSNLQSSYGTTLIPIDLAW